MARTSALALLLLAATALFAQTQEAAPSATSTATPPAQATAPANAKPIPDSVYFVLTKSYPTIYSDKAEKAKLRGPVLLSILFNEAGAVESTEVVSGDPVLAQCAITSLEKWEIQPYFRGGKAVKVKVPMSFEFIYDEPPISFTTGEATSQPAGATADRIVLSRELAQNHVINDKRPRPQYPSEAKSRGIQGTVTFGATVGKDGAIYSLVLASGHPLLAQAAAEAVRQWHYKPLILHGQPVYHDIRVDVHFELSGSL
jgi:TonB family protein